MPIHILSAINPPSSVLKEIDKLLSKCFWRNSENKSTYHWISWKTCCNTKKDGGLGLRKLKDIIHVQSLKLCWKILTEDTLWTSFMRNKYHKEFTDLKYRSDKTSNNWKRLKSVMEEAKAYTDYTSEGYKWKLSSDGRFSAKYTWEFIRDNRSDSCSFDYVWIKPIPKRISVFLWKLLHNRLPLDHNIRRLGFQLASKCSCCKIRKEENQTHLFLISETAKKVWRFFSESLGIKNFSTNLSTYLKCWWKRAQTKEETSIIFHGLPAVVCWEIWKSRNRSRFEDEDMDADRIIWSVKNTMKGLTELKDRKKGSPDLEAYIREVFG